MKIIKALAVAVAAFFVVPALAQNVGTVSNHAVPIGQGVGKQGFKSVAPSTAGMPLISNGASSDPSFQDITRTGLVATGTWQGTVVAAGFGGTGQSTYTIGDLLQASASGALSALNAVATGNVLISGGVGTVSSWGKVGLTTHVSGTLPKANGGLGATTLSSAIDTEFSSTQGSVLYRSASAWVALGPGTSGQLLSTGGPAANPSWITASGTGTVTSAQVAAGTGISVSGTCTITSTGVCTVATALSTVTNSLAGDVAMNITGTYFTGPTVAQGTSGTWFASGTVTMTMVTGTDNLFCKLWDGTTVASSGAAGGGTEPNGRYAVSLSGAFTSPVGNIRISCLNNNHADSFMVFNVSGNSKDSTLTVVRIQ